MEIGFISDGHFDPLTGNPPPYCDLLKKSHSIYSQNVFKTQYFELLKRQERINTDLRKAGYEPHIIYHCQWMQRTRKTPLSVEYLWFQNFHKLFIPPFIPRQVSVVTDVRFRIWKVFLSGLAWRKNRGLSYTWRFRSH